MHVAEHHQIADESGVVGRQRPAARTGYVEEALVPTLRSGIVLELHNLPPTSAHSLHHAGGGGRAAHAFAALLARLQSDRNDLAKLKPALRKVPRGSLHDPRASPGGTFARK